MTNASAHRHLFRNVPPWLALALALPPSQTPCGGGSQGWPGTAVLPRGPAGPGKSSSGKFTTPAPGPGSLLLRAASTERCACSVQMEHGCELGPVADGCAASDLRTVVSQARRPILVLKTCDRRRAWAGEATGEPCAERIVKRTILFLCLCYASGRSEIPERGRQRSPHTWLCEGQMLLS